MTNETVKESTPLYPIQDRTTMWLSISMSAFLFLWLFGMDILSIFDSVVFFTIVTCISTGTVRGGIKEFFGFFGVLASLLAAVTGYRVLYDWTKFDFGTGNDLWGEMVWFLLLLGICWLVCFLLSCYLQKKMERVSTLRTFNTILGSILAGFKGAILGYVFIILIMITGITHRNVALERQFQFSYVYQMGNSLENRYHFIENLVKMESAQKMYMVHEKIRMQRIAADLFPENSEFEKKTAQFLVELALKPAKIQKLPFSKEAQKCMERFLLIPEAKKIWETDPDVKKMKSEKEITVFHICEILRKPQIIELAKNKEIIQIMKEIKFDKLEMELD